MEIKTKELARDSWKAEIRGKYKTPNLLGVGYGTSKTKAIEAAKLDFEEEKRKYDR
jgi:hypothetical protein